MMLINLFFCFFGFQWYIKATTDKGKAKGWMRLSCDPVTRPELCKSVCEVWDGSKWTSQQSVSIVTAKQRREEDKKAGAERRAQSVSVDVRGAYGPSATSINGVYEPTSEVCGGWPVYRKQGDPDKWLEYIVATNEVYSCSIHSVVFPLIIITLSFLQE